MNYLTRFLFSFFMYGWISIACAGEHSVAIVNKVEGLSRALKRTDSNAVKTARMFGATIFDEKRSQSWRTFGKKVSNKSTLSTLVPVVDDAFKLYFIESLIQRYPVDMRKQAEKLFFQDIFFDSVHRRIYDQLRTVIVPELSLKTSSKAIASKVKDNSPQEDDIEEVEYIPQLGKKKKYIISEHVIEECACHLSELEKKFRQLELSNEKQLETIALQAIFLGLLIEKNVRLTITLIEIAHENHKLNDMITEFRLIVNSQSSQLAMLTNNKEELTKIWKNQLSLKENTINDIKQQYKLILETRNKEIQKQKSEVDRVTKEREEGKRDFTEQNKALQRWITHYKYGVSILSFIIFLLLVDKYDLMAHMKLQFS